MVRITMATNYDQLYRKTAHALGAPDRELVKFFETRIDGAVSVLDLGCGQGRDALFIARLGHSVVGVDSSEVGVDQLNRQARKEGLAIAAEIGDLTDYQPAQIFDSVLFDRVLHMLKAQTRLELLCRCAERTCASGFVLIVDEPANIGAMLEYFDSSAIMWNTLVHRKGRLFVQRV